MQKSGGGVLFSAGDVVAFLECEHATTLAPQDLETPLPRAEDDETLDLIQQKGFAHESAFLSSLKAKDLRLAEIPGDGSPEALARNPKAKFVVQLAFYSDLLAQAQGAEPRAMHLALGDGAERS